MIREELVWVLGGMIAAALVLVVLHEKHYTGRRERIESARSLGLLAGLELRVRTVEEILMEDRET